MRLGWASIRGVLVTMPVIGLQRGVILRTMTTGHPAHSHQDMFCDRCGAYAIRRVALDGEQGTFACGACGRCDTRRVLPLHIVTGASGAGKTTIITIVQRTLVECGVFDKDALWATDWDMVYNNFFRIASSLAQGGRRAVVIGTILPEFLTGLSDRDLVGTIHYANLHCDDASRERRLLTRRTWDVPARAFIEKHQAFAAWLLAEASTAFDPPMPTFDTTQSTPDEVAAQVVRWVRSTIHVNA